MNSGVRVLADRPHVVLRDVIVGGGAVRLRLLLLMSLGDDDVASIRADVDDVAEVIVGVVVHFYSLVLMALYYAMMAYGTLLIAHPVALSLDVIVFIFRHNSVGDA